MPPRRIGPQVFLREPKEPHGRIHASSVLRMRRPRELLLQMHEPARGLNQAFEVVGVLTFRAQPKVLEHVVRLVVALLVPAKEEPGVARMLRDFPARAARRRAAQLLNQPGNSLVFVHEELNLDSAEMTGNRARRVFAEEGSRARRAAVRG